jgi:hypothetical protein
MEKFVEKLTFTPEVLKSVRCGILMLFGGDA